MGAYGALAMLMLAGFSALNPHTVSWAYVAAFVMFELWLLRKMNSVGKLDVPANEPPYHFDEVEARLVTRYRFYFTYPGIAKEAGPVLSALGLTAILLAPWLTFKNAFLPAIVIGLNLFAVGRFTTRLAPIMALRIAASKGDRDALRLLEAHDPAWEKIRVANRETPP